MQVQVPAERVTQEIAARLKKLSRTARLKGFRPGKAPLTVIRQQFGVQVHREVIGELMQASFAEAVTERQLSPAGNPRIEPQSVDEGQDLKYVATFEVFPEVALQPVENLELERITAEVSESDIDAMVERLRKQQLKYAPVERAAAAGDKVTIDFSGTIDGAEFAGGKGADVAIVLGEGRMLPQLEQGLIGAAATGDKVTIDFVGTIDGAEFAGGKGENIAIVLGEGRMLPELERIKAEVTESDVDAMIERLRKQQLKYSPVERAAAAGDKVTIDFSGTIDGAEFAGGKGADVAIVLGEGRMLPQLEQGLIGAAAGEHRDISVNFPADYRATELAGKLAVFSTDVKSVEAAALPELDEEFCKSFGVAEGGMPKLREDVAANMRREIGRASCRERVLMPV